MSLKNNSKKLTAGQKRHAGDYIPGNVGYNSFWHPNNSILQGKKPKSKKRKK